RVRTRRLLSVGRDDLDLVEAVEVKVAAKLGQDVSGVLVWDQPEVELGCCLSGQDCLRSRSLVARRHPGEVACRREQQLLDHPVWRWIAHQLFEADKLPAL